MKNEWLDNYCLAGGYPDQRNALDHQTWSTQWQAGSLTRQSCPHNFQAIWKAVTISVNEKGINEVLGGFLAEITWRYRYCGNLARYPDS